VNRQEAVARFAEVLESGFLRALAEPARLEILAVLLELGPADVGAVADRLPQERSVISRHLKILREAGAVAVERDGRRRVYAVDGQSILARFEAILRQARAVAPICCPAPGRAVSPAPAPAPARRSPRAAARPPRPARAAAGARRGR
jgi:DNA-binding transcriptional ArsR family regulator